ncbi:hypothetical protein TWF569_009636 [Orbilia oligospora]|uniref:RBP protein n=1 Tax=Orbilia oligospora TaxID=2813651 RepID=A0A7C8JMI6_ORBOL|nr:hypothetical protein TWF706_011817 [Orbilia oligospora]KAF3111926.1 hypothetical protein TWF102_005687 [Orbilia oligospora]KAF3114611.1 hypothetical protein TWF103_001071 [Orbilia oligospora]KAF3135698.1 hypothetical protein TWF569_009636 [Orbilia oligospora]KAF3142020.1 hypothetical protein TWF703_001243 [Orbilia oligospora]
MSTYQTEEIMAEGGVRWILSHEEREHLGELLDVDASTFDNLKGNIMNRSRMACKKCGKLSGLDDIVHGAVELGVHTKGLMIHTLVHGPAGGSPAHAVDCSRCSEQFEGVFLWFSPSNWTF